MGYAGNCEPSFIVPTVIGTRDGNLARNAGKAAGSIDDLDFVVGDDALAGANAYNINYPVRHGMVENWDNMERFWQRSIFSYLRCDPAEHAFLLTEPPMNTPENRELTAASMFETFNVRRSRRARACARAGGTRARAGMISTARRATARGTERATSRDECRSWLPFDPHSARRAIPAWLRPAEPSPRAEAGGGGERAASERWQMRARPFPFPLPPPSPRRRCVGCTSPSRRCSRSPRRGRPRR